MVLSGCSSLNPHVNLSCHVVILHGIDTVAPCHHGNMYHWRKWDFTRKSDRNWDFRWRDVWIKNCAIWKTSISLINMLIKLWNYVFTKFYNDYVKVNFIIHEEPLTVKRRKTKCCRVFLLLLEFLAATKQLYEWFSPSVCPSVCLSVCLSVCHTFLTMFPSSYHHEIFGSYYQWQKWRPCKRSRSEVKGQGHRGHNPTLPFPDCNSSLNSHMMMKWCI